ncbi:(3R)-3-hydroxyacyl-CoA dehydrogenase-like isoform X1 [Dermacentor andersoni]|uniref:(3R)-3-hydroxyacyl-CoA dehydrogenase-like isoform X1 n=1 Tax=Dermacentor andersoni TaxID=34620 RepID=UPI00241798A3|nr:(3R)-3-hydroxyacyl-CoA dehydrogenase-like isoform X1 [Dermacentor andersoni]
MTAVVSVFTGRLALVTGGASGIGKAVCGALAAEGAVVVVADKQLDAAKEVAESLPETCLMAHPATAARILTLPCVKGDAKHRAIYVDVGDASSVEQLFRDVRNAFSEPLSVVVNSAGILRKCSLVDCTDETFDDVIRVNLKGTFLVNRAASRDMLQSGIPDGGAAIVNVSSIEAKSGFWSSAVYSASKAGIVALTKSVAQELAGHGIRCNAVLPGWTDTPLAASSDEAVKAQALALMPIKRPAEPREIAEAIKFLCSPTASSYVNGAALEVTGGFCM